MSTFTRAMRRLNKTNPRMGDAMLSNAQTLWRPFARLSRQQRAGYYRCDALNAAARIDRAADLCGFGIEARRTERELRFLAGSFRKYCQKQDEY